jgi:hypothetical protein
MEWDGMVWVLGLDLMGFGFASILFLDSHFFFVRLKYLRIRRALSEATGTTIAGDAS